jgi:2,6-dihydroxypyridine 3-monooxygenase
VGETLKVAIAGGSIGGLTAAVLLHELGLEVDVYERSTAALEARGAGIVVLPMTERYFVERGGSDDRISLELPWWKYVDAAGTELSADLDHFRFSSWNTVYRALLDSLPPDRYHLGHEVVGFEQEAGSVLVRFAHGESSEAGLLVCADGMSSTARQLLLPGVEPVYAGYVAWRGTTAENDLPGEAIDQLAESMLYQVLEPGHILVYAIPGSDGSLSPGRRLQNFVWYRNYSPGEAFDDLMTDREGERRSASVPPGLVAPEHVARLRAATVELAPVLRQIVEQCPDPFVQAIFDLEVPQMVFRRVCLLGDAAFSARPHVAAGTAKAAADAWALRDALRGTPDDLEGALADWQSSQLELGRSVVARSRAMGERSQFTGSMIAGDPDWKFGLFEPGN